MHPCYGGSRMESRWLLVPLLCGGVVLSYRAGLPGGARRLEARAIISLILGGVIPLLIFCGAVLLSRNLDVSPGLASFAQSVVWGAGVALLPVATFWLGTVLGKVLVVASR